MFNHVRTLLLNRDADSAVFPGEEAIPADFRPVTPPSYQQVLRAKLFGADPDKAMLNYRLRQYMTLLHATPLGHYVTDLDPRITYLPFGTDLYAQGLFQPTIERVAGNGPDGFLQGSPAPSDSSGRMYFTALVTTTQQTITVEISDGDSVLSLDTLPMVLAEPESDAVSVITYPTDRQTVQVTTIAPAYSAAATETALDARPSDPDLLGDALPMELSGSPESTGDLLVVPLGKTGYSVMLPPFAVGTSWRITGYLPPARDLSQVLSDLATIGEPILLALFGVAPVEPYATFQKLFTRYDQLVYRMSGLLLALAYRMDELWRGGAGG